MGKQLFPPQPRETILDSDKRFTWLRRGLPLTLFTLVSLYEVIEHFITSNTGFNQNFLVETLFFGVLGPTAVYFALGWMAQLYTERIATARQLEKLNAELRAKEALREQLLHQIINAQEAERMRIARQLHDEFAQGLMAFMLSVDAVVPYLKDAPPNLISEIQRARDLADEILRQTRSLMLDLRPVPLEELGLVPALRDLAARLLEPRGIHVQVSRQGKPYRLSDEVEITLYRIGQEAMNNVLQHAHPSQVHVLVDYQPHQLVMRVEDNGRGFDPQTLPKSTQQRGWGLIGMQERVNLLGGELKVQSSPGKGTCIELRVPVSRKRNG